MAGKKPWAKLWVAWYHTADWLSISLAQKGAWWMLYSLAQELEADGRMVQSDGPMTLRDIKRALHLEERSDRRIFDRMIERRLAQGGLHWDGDTLVISEFSTEQKRTTSSDPEAVKERVRRWREGHPRPTQRSRHGTEARQSVTDNQLPEEESEPKPTESGSQLVTDLSALPLSPLSSISQEDRGSGGKGQRGASAEKAMVAELSRCYLDVIGSLSASVRELFDEFLEEYHSPAEGIPDAFKEGVKYGKRNWAYIRQILMNWQDEGREGVHYERPAEGHAVPEGDPLAGARKSGWDVEKIGEHDGAEEPDEG